MNAQEKLKAYKKRVHELERDLRKREERTNDLVKTMARKDEETLPLQSEVKRLTALLAEKEAKELIGK